ncbi:TPA: polymerase, partial [Streptococcus agalactiae]
IAIIFFEYLTNNSDSYTYRVQGIINFFNYYQSDYFHLLFGDAQLAFGGTTQNYTYNIRSVIGWNGTVEMPLLSIMIKNGFIGLLGYTVVLLSFFKNIKKIKNINIKTVGLLVIIPLLMSATVENYIVNVNFIFMPICFCVLNSLKRLEHNLNV